MTKEGMTSLTYNGTCKQVIEPITESRRIVWHMGGSVKCCETDYLLHIAYKMMTHNSQEFPCKKKNRSILGWFSNRWVSHGRCAHHAFSTCFMLLMMGLGPMFSALRAPRCVFCAFGCDLLFGLWSFPFVFLVPLLVVFSLIYLFIFASTLFSKWWILLDQHIL